MKPLRYDRYGQRHHDYPAVPNTSTRAERDRAYRERVERIANLLATAIVFAWMVFGCLGYGLFLWTLRQ